MAAFCFTRRLRLFEIARVLVRFDHVAGFIVNAHNRRVKYWEIIADNLSKAGWSWGWADSYSNGDAWTDSAQGPGEKGEWKIHCVSTEGATSAAVDVYRDDVLIATTPNAPPFLYTDFTGDTGRAQYTYRVCQGVTQTCSNDLRVRFQE